MRRQIGRVMAAVLLAACLGCEEDIVLVEETDRAFSLYGVLNPQADTQYVHVFPIEGSLGSPPPAPLGAVVTSTDLTTGERRVWSDSLVQDAQGHYGHVFWAPFRVVYDRSYRLEVTAPEAGASSAEVLVPDRVRPLEEPPVTTRQSLFVPVRLEGVVPKLTRLLVTFTARTVIGVDGVTPIYRYEELVLPYGERAERIAEGWRVPVEMHEAYTRLYDKFATSVPAATLEDSGIELLLIRLDVIVSNEEWELPEGEFDPLALSYPDVLTNVENGYGFVGAGYRVRHEWRPAAEVLVSAGFTPPGG